MHQACKIYKGVCSCDKSYIGETVRNVEVHWVEYNNPTKVSNLAKHIKDNVDHTFHCSVLARADLSKQKALDEDSRAIQQIIFTGKASTDVMVYYILEQSKETILQFSKGTTKVL